MTADSRKAGTERSKPSLPQGPVPVYAVHGPEPFLRLQAVQQLVDSLLDRADRTMCFSEYDGREAKLHEVLDDVRTLALFASRRVVLVRDADEFITKYRKDLEAYVAAPSPSGVLILECVSLPKNQRLCRLIDACGGRIPCEPPRRSVLPRWIAEWCRTKYDKRIEADAVRSLLDHVGDSLGLLDSELGKLAVYVGSRSAITRADVVAITGHQREQKVFGILNAMADGDRATALRLWEEVWETDREAEYRAIGGIAWGVRQFLEAHEAIRGGAPVEAMAQRYYTDPMRLQMRLRAFPASRLQDLLCHLCEVDVANKTGAGSVRSLIERFIVENSAVRVAGGAAAGARAG